MRVFSKLKFFIITLALVLLFGNIGLGAYIVGSKNASVEGNVSINSVGDAVCEIGSTKYTSIEKALAVAYSTNGAQTIRVLPGINGYTISRPCTLGSGDSLLIPYDDTCSLKNPTADVEISGFADNNPDTYRKTLVVLSSTLTIESGATLVICGKTGGANPQGGTTGDYAELQFTSSGYIDCSGDITCYGYIHDQAEKQRAVDDVCIYMHKGIIKEPLAMYDWGSASTAQGKMGNGAFPINHFDFPNIRAPMYFEYGSKLVAMGNVYALKMHIKADGTIVATDSDEAFLQLKNGSGVLINANNVDGLKTSGSVNKHSVSVRANGDLNISAVVVELKVGIINYTLDSKKYYLPISGIYDVTMVSGICNVNYNTKFLPGSSLTINQGASVEFVKNSVFYNSTTSNNGSKMPDSSTFTKPAMLINNGTLTIDSGFEGVVQTLNSNSKIITKATYTNDSNCFEATENQKIGPFYFGGGTGTILYKQYDKSKPNGYCYVDYSKRDIEAGKTYLGTQIDSRTEYGWYDGSDSYVSYGINFSSSMKEYSNPNNTSTLNFKKNGSEEEVKPLIPNDSSKYLFDGYYYDSNFSSKLKYEGSKDTYLIEPSVAITYIDQVGYLTLYAKWVDATIGTYTITTVTKGQSLNKLGVINNEPVIVSKTVGNSLELENRKDNSFYYYQAINGTNGTGTIVIARFDGYTISIKDSQGVKAHEDIVVSKDGNSADGLITGFALSDNSLVKKDYVVEVTEVLSEQSYSYAFSISKSSNSTVEQGESVTLSMNHSPNAIDECDVSLSYVWTSADSKVQILNGNMKDCQAKNIYSSTTRWPHKVETKDAKISCKVTDGTIVLVNSLSVNVNVKSVAYKLL